MRRWRRSTPHGRGADSEERNLLEVLITLVLAFETNRWPFDAPDPVPMIEHVMEARGCRQKDLAAVIGSQPHASEVLRRRRPLTLPMIRALSAECKLPVDTLVREYDPSTRDVNRFLVVLSKC